MKIYLGPVIKEVRTALKQKHPFAEWYWERRNKWIQQLTEYVKSRSGKAMRFFMGY